MSSERKSARSTSSSARMIAGEWRTPLSLRCSISLGIELRAMDLVPYPGKNNAENIPHNGSHHDEDGGGGQIEWTDGNGQVDHVRPQYEVIASLGPSRCPKQGPREVPTPEQRPCRKTCFLDI